MTFKPGDKVLVRSVPDDVLATIDSLFGSGRDEYARLTLELPGDDERPILKSLTLPTNLLRKAA